VVESFLLPSISRKDVHFTDTKFLTQLSTLALKLQNHRFFGTGQIAPHGDNSLASEWGLSTPPEAINPTGSVFNINDLGSPGVFAIPEPASWAIPGVGGVALLAWRHYKRVI